MTKARKSDERELPAEAVNAALSESADESDDRDAQPVILPDDGETWGFGDTSGRWKIESADANGRFVVADATIAPRTLVAPLHRHRNEDEYSYVLDGTLGAVVGDAVVTAEAGTWVHKPRGQWHTLWNAEDAPCRVLEIVSPAGFESYFEEVAAAGDDTERFAQINEKYGIEMDFESVAILCEHFGLTPSEL